MSARYIVADVFDGLATLPDDSVDVIITSPPFLALRSYLPADDPLKAKEIGSEPTPAAWLDLMLRFTAELRRVLAPHGSIAIELGDTYANVAPGGNAYGAGPSSMTAKIGDTQQWNGGENVPTLAKLGEGWPLAKSKTLIPELYRIALAYGINPLTGEQSPAGQWRVRNVVTWARPNPPVGALGDKWRPATSDVVVACVSGKRYWDDLATRRPYMHPNHPQLGKEHKGDKWRETAEGGDFPLRAEHPSGAPLLDYWEIPLLDGDEEKRYGPVDKGPTPNPRTVRHSGVKGDPNGGRDTLGPYAGNVNPAGSPLLDYWVIPPGGYEGSHYAVFPPELVVPLVKAMTPEKVCRDCGEPSRRITGETEYVNSKTGKPVTTLHMREGSHIPGQGNTVNSAGLGDRAATAITPTLGWTDCGHNNYRPGMVCDPFAGSGTTLLVATGHGHDAIGIDLDRRNAELALERVGPFMLEVLETHR